MYGRRGGRARLFLNSALDVHSKFQARCSGLKSEWTLCRRGIALALPETEKAVSLVVELIDYLVYRLNYQKSHERFKIEVISK